LPVALRSEGPARIRFSAGETYDFEWIPETPGAAALELEWQFPTEPGSLILRQPIRVRGE
jgi:hypothetical protein